jgi:hypothetical protein
MTKVTLKQDDLFVVSPTYNAELAELTNSALRMGATVTPVGRNVVYEFAGELLPLEVAKQIKDIVVSIEDYPLWIEIDSEDDEVPEGVFGSTNAEGELHTWATWKKPNHTFLEIGDRIFIGANAHTGEYLSLTDLEDVLDDVLSQSQINALQAEYAVEE